MRTKDATCGMAMSVALLLQRKIGEKPENLLGLVKAAWYMFVLSHVGGGKGHFQRKHNFPYQSEQPRDTTREAGARPLISSLRNMKRNGII